MELEVTVYTTNCPQCKMLEAMLKKQNIDHKVVYGADEITKRGHTSAPIMEVDGEILTFAQAVRWLNALEEGDRNAR